MFQYLSVGHPPYYKGLDYIYEDRGEVCVELFLHAVALFYFNVITVYLTQGVKLFQVLDMRIFETGEYALAWVGVPTAPAWLPTDMLIKVQFNLFQLQLLLITKLLAGSA